MAAPRRKNEVLQERIVLPPLAHASLTASTTFKLWKVPAGKTFLIDRVLYINPTGLVENTANNFACELKNGASSLADISIQGEADDEIFTAASHGMVTGAGPYRLTGTLPTGTTAHTNYYIIRLGVNTFKLATTRALALAGTAVAITTDGTGVTLVRNLITRVFDTDSDLTPDIGASLAADTFLEFTSDATVMSRTVAGGDTLSAVFTETGIATLPAGTLVIEGRLL